MPHNETTIRENFRVAGTLRLYVQLFDRFINNCEYMKRPIERNGVWREECLKISIDRNLAISINSLKCDNLYNHHTYKSATD